MLATVEYLGEHGIPALPGWRYLAQAVDPADHARRARRPPRAGRRRRHHRPRHATPAPARCWHEAALLPRSAVAVGTAAALLAPTPAPGGAGQRRRLPRTAEPGHARRARRRRGARRRCGPGPPRGTRRSGRWPPGSPRTARSPPGSPPGAPAARPGGSPSWRRGRATATRGRRGRRGRTRRGPRRRAPRPTRPPPRPPRVRDERQEAAAAGPPGRRRARGARLPAAGARRLAGQAARTRRRRRRVRGPRRRSAWTGPAPPTRTAAPPSAPPTTPAAPPARCAPSAPRSPAPPTTCPEPDAGRPARLAARAARGLPRRLPAVREGRRRRRPARRTGPRRERRERRARRPGPAQQQGPHPRRPAAGGPRRRRRPLPAGRRGPRRVPRADPGDPRVRRQRAARPAARRGRAARPRRRRARTPSCPTELVPRRRRARPGAAAHRHRRTRRRAPRRWKPPAPRTRSCSRAHRAAEDAAGGFDETAALLRDLLRDAPRTARRTTRGRPSRTRAAWRRPGRPPPRPAARCAAAPPTCPPPRPRCARRATCSSGTPTPPATSRSAPPPASRSASCPAPRCPSTPQPWADAFAPRLRVLTDELAQLERNRDSIVDRLRGLVESALATLRSAQRLSRLPEGLGEWSGQEFLRIRFEEPGPGHAHRAARRGHRRGDPRGRQEELRPAPRRHVPAAARGRTRRCSRAGVAVEILKPDAVLRAERVPVGQMGDVFSGGQLLTAAIALYCTMAALRSNDRGPRQAPARRHAVPRQPHRPRQRDLPAGAPAGRGRRARRPAALHHRPLRHHRARRVPAGHPAAQRRGPAGGAEVHQRRGAPAARACPQQDPDGGAGARRDHRDPDVPPPGGAGRRAPTSPQRRAQAAPAPGGRTGAAPSRGGPARPAPRSGAVAARGSRAGAGSPLPAAAGPPAAAAAPLPAQRAAPRCSARTPPRCAGSTPAGSPTRPAPPRWRPPCWPHVESTMGNASQECPTAQQQRDHRLDQCHATRPAPPAPPPYVPDRAAAAADGFFLPHRLACPTSMEGACPECSGAHSDGTFPARPAEPRRTHLRVHPTGSSRLTPFVDGTRTPADGVDVGEAMRFRGKSIRRKIVALLLVPLVSLTAIWALRHRTSPAARRCSCSDVGTSSRRSAIPLEDAVQRPPAGAPADPDLPRRPPRLRRAARLAHASRTRHRRGRRQAAHQTRPTGDVRDGPGRTTPTRGSTPSSTPSTASTRCGRRSRTAPSPATPGLRRLQRARRPRYDLPRRTHAGSTTSTWTSRAARWSASIRAREALSREDALMAAALSRRQASTRADLPRVSDLVAERNLLYDTNLPILPAAERDALRRDYWQSADGRGAAHRRGRGHRRPAPRRRGHVVDARNAGARRPPTGPRRPRPAGQRGGRPSPAPRRPGRHQRA